MFQLDFFKIVKRVCDNEPWKTIYPNEHESYVMMKKNNPNSERPQNRGLCEYIQYTYPQYFEIKLHLPHALVKNSNRLTKEQKQNLFFE
jgi:hypothetical protein